MAATVVTSLLLDSSNFLSLMTKASFADSLKKMSPEFSFSASSLGVAINENEKALQDSSQSQRGWGGGHRGRSSGMFHNVAGEASLRNLSGHRGEAHTPKSP